MGVTGGAGGGVGVMETSVSGSGGEHTNRRRRPW